MKKYVVLLLSILLLFSACGKGASGSSAGDSSAEASDGSETAGSASGIYLSDVKEEIISSLNITEYTEIESERLMDLYGIDEADIVQSSCFTTVSGAFPDEVVMVEAKDEEAAKKIAEKLQNRLTEVLNQYKDYDAESYAMAEKCSVDTDGTIVSLFLSSQQEAMKQALKAVLS